MRTSQLAILLSLSLLTVPALASAKDRDPRLAAAADRVYSRAARTVVTPVAATAFVVAGRQYFALPLEYTRPGISGRSWRSSQATLERVPEVIGQHPRLAAAGAALTSAIVAAPYLKARYQVARDRRAGRAAK